jgi:ATP-dependent RNA helicase DDX51/DBP6
MFGIDSRLKETLSASKFRVALPIQVATWRTIYTWPLERDFLLKAGTGKGKTLAYVLPVLNALNQRLDKRKKVVIVVPSAELAKQVANTFHHLADSINASVDTLTTTWVNRISTSSRLERIKFYRSTIHRDACAGSKTKYMHANRFQKTRTCDILIVTPKHFPFDTPTTSENVLCVVDEADKLIYQMHQDWLGRLKRAIQTSKRCGAVLVGEKSHSTLRVMLVSATIPCKGRETHIMGLRAVKIICEHGERQGLPSQPVKLREVCVVVNSNEKFEVLLRVLDLFGLESTLVLTSSVQRAHELWYQLQRIVPNLSPVEFNSSASKLLQTNSLNAFRHGFSKLMIASDSASRGLDIPGISLVVSYDVPTHIETYIHRTGRTARAGTIGTAITLCSAQQLQPFDRLINELNMGKHVRHYQATEILHGSFTLDSEI